MARREGQRLAKTRAEAADWVINNAPGARSDLISAAILRMTGTSLVGSERMSMGARLDSRAWAERAALAVPQGPSHHQRKEPAGVGCAGVVFSFDEASTLAVLSSL